MSRKRSKIVILTQPLHINYGGVLQAYALQRVLKEMGHDVVTDRHVESSKQWNPPFYINNAVYHYAWQIFRLLTGRRPIYWRYSFCSYAKLLETIGGEILRFTRENISTIELFDRQGRVKPQYKDTFDTYVVGSDQVWYTPYNECVTNYFLGFLDKNKDVNRVAYAASFGVDNLDSMNPNLKSQCAEYLSIFNAVSVREKSGVTLCKRDLGAEAEFVLDPTLLLKRDDYMAICRNVAHVNDILYTYILDNDGAKESICENLASSLNLDRVSRAAKGRYPVVSIENAKTPSIESWLAGYRDANFVVTDSYHGTIFAIIFGKPFITIINHSRGASRFTSLLNILGLESRLVDEYVCTDNINMLINSQIDYNKVYKKLDSYCRQSIDFLSKI